MRSHPQIKLIKPRPQTLSRRLPQTFAKEIRQYAKRTGVAAWAWNELHKNLFLIFWFLLGPAHLPGRRALAHGIWHTIQSDLYQRQMLLKTAKNVLIEENKKPMVARIVWLVSQADKFSAWRNIAAHVPAVFSGYTTRVPVADGSSTRDQMRERFNEIDHQQFWTQLTGDLIALSRYAARVAFDIDRPGADGPLPHRPRLLSLREMAEIDNRINHRMNLQNKKPRPSSSHRKRKRPGPDNWPPQT